jgi:subtilisin-like proprotein convertase family protein
MQRISFNRFILGVVIVLSFGFIVLSGDTPSAFNPQLALGAGTYCRHNLNKAIANNSTVKDTIVVNVPIGITILDLNVKIDTILHNRVSDLHISLIHGALNSDLVLNRGGSGNNFYGTILNDSASTLISAGTAPFTGSFKPETPLSVMNGSALNGTYILEVADQVSGQAGTLVAWCVTIKYSTETGIVNTITVPGKYGLKQNYPNPFNPTTTISYNLPKVSNVKLVVFDMLGRQVRTLVNERKAAGSYSVDFNASDLSSGMYFYKLAAEDFADVKRMVLIK